MTSWIDEAPPAAALPEPGASALYVVDLYNRMRRYFAVPDGPRWAWRRMHDWAERLLRERRPTHVACASDNPWPTWRSERAPGRWKAGRQQLPPAEKAAFLEQVRIAEEVLWDALGIRTFAVKGFDGDDVAASLAEIGTVAGLPVVLASNDTDLLQLVVTLGAKEGVVAWNCEHVGGRVLGPDGVRGVLGVWPWQVVDRMALVGKDAPGVEGIGEKSATTIIQEFSDLDSALEELAVFEEELKQPARGVIRSRWVKIGVRYAAALSKGRVDALLSRELVQLRRDALPGVTADDLRA